MQNNLLLLKKIQEIDIQINSAEEESRRFNADLERLSEEVKEYEARLGTIRGELDGLEDMKRSFEDELAVCAERINKNETRLKNVKNDKEFNAATKELNAAKKEKQTKENEIARLNNETDEKKATIEEHENKLREKQAEIAAKNRTIEEGKEKQEEWIKGKKDEKAVIAKDIPPAVIKKYETIRERRQGIAISQVVAGTCQGCYMNIPPQAYIQLQKGSSDLIFCPHCHRILYWHPSPEPSEQQKESAGQQSSN